MAHNRYYTINNNDPNKAEILTFSVGKPETQRYSINGSQLVIKLHEGDHEQHPQLLQYTEYTHAEILPIMDGPEWTNEIL
jgi:hypothetical protein